MVIVAAAAAHTLFGVGGSGLDVPVRDWASSAVYVLVAAIVVAARGPGRAVARAPGS